MSDHDHVEIDPVTQEQVHGTAIPQTDVSGDDRVKGPKNAFSELMSPKPRPVPKPSDGPLKQKNNRAPYFPGRDGLKAYTVSPASFGPDRVITHDAFSVLIRDLYPKASVHTLVLPRDPTLNALHPFDAFAADHPEFLAATKAAVAAAVEMVAGELRRRYGRFSATERPRIEALESDEPPDPLPAGRDWRREVKTGIHAQPSMAHLHVHVLSVDNYSEWMKHRRHYENFNTDFLVPLEAFPLDKDDPRRDPEGSGILGRDLKCWRCGMGFGNKWKRLEEHLEVEFEAWKRE